jgi:ABC-2 type transport system permease protein
MGPSGPSERGARSRSVVAFDQAVELSRRSIVALIRQPQTWAPALIFPLLLSAVYSAQFGRAISQPGFPPVDSFLDFLLPAAILQAIAFNATNGGSDLALDIETGFYDRLIASPVSRVSIIVGRLAGSAAFALVQAVVLLAIFLGFGARVKGGLGGAFVVIGVAVILALAIGGLAVTLAMKTGSQEAVMATFPLIFVMLFISSAFFPTSTMNGWYKQAALRNPVTWIVDATRRLVIEGFSWSDAGRALGISTAFAVAAIALAFAAQRRRLRAH